MHDFAGSAAVGALAVLGQYEQVPSPSGGLARALAVVGYALVFIYGVRVAGMFMITTTSLARAAGQLPRWVALVSYLAAVLLLLSATFHPAIALAFPAWVVLVSLTLLARTAPLRARVRRPRMPSPTPRG